MLLNQTALALIGLLLAAWSVLAGWAILSARRKARRAQASQRNVARLSRMIDQSPALPLLIRDDGRIEGSARLARWFGLEALPGYLSELAGGSDGGPGLADEQIAAIAEAVSRTRKTAAPFDLVVAPLGSERSLALHGTLADPAIAPGGAALVWVSDVTEREAELRRLAGEAAEAEASYAGLVGLIEAAPLPMWFRGPDLKLMLVNGAYVAAVGSDSAESVVAGQSELVERVGGLSAGQVAGQALASQQPIERVVTATIAGQRRSFRVSDLPLDGGVAGYAIDIQDLDEQTRAIAALREAQRSMLDTLSAAIAQFDRGRRLAFANSPFLALFGIPQAMVADSPPFERLLERMRDNGRVPDVRDFPQWRRERQAWFTAGEVQEEPWLLPDGTHLRVVAQPLPEGGLLLIFEDRTEQLQLAATRDTLLRTRTATFDNLFESVAVFAPDGRLQLWNRRFAANWGLPEPFLDEHPHADRLLERIAPKLKRPQQVNVVGTVIRAATLERTGRGGRLSLADGRSLEFAGVPLPDGNGLLTVLDVTDSQKAERALRERNAALVEADAIKTRFIANMAYEFRTPLTSIGGFAEMLASGLAGELGEQQRDYVAAIAASAGRLGEQIEKLLDLAQSEAGTLPFRRAPLELGGLIEEVIGHKREDAAKAGVALDVRGLDGEVPLEGDRRRLGRALTQLLDNAVAASPAGATVAVELARRSAGGARVIVTDAGEGMDAASAARALDGLRLSRDGRTIEQRQGLGLPLARKLIEAHGGSLELHSEPGRGTSAVVLLP